ncbi:hypothetical protein PHYBLDRAFT_60695 [Phycomyces blakesleeanus NRRL 1555(-)]|uniref:Uncharacterized protein n=1 Tax=Phycomyces blakesleeanus (strain ATCC 8743b / DSM 1359 / FGSC 10004 / NBRC 33097 / NRRL 1555) TaxID=763407 RepID=A0A162USC0_PHYB8|nr:hypothetical protein PHYBLDRAFT_60695 [Phycomyces blakesleeanus NRRL 1555(-)]OAD77563.1 hypothetical protein PHYBLDRAFT_60695 [Phycomyces blakesleeanus NRRL 1555(-)]|eukprot:XP_018295603.1 hypothetical protein PHYBLDRAFT_60695 [Phycomyces blakesleeanus NRRL 1555(-)]
MKFRLVWAQDHCNWTRDQWVPIIWPDEFRYSSKERLEETIRPEVDSLNDLRRVLEEEWEKTGVQCTGWLFKNIKGRCQVESLVGIWLIWIFNKITNFNDNIIFNDNINELQ